MHDYLRSRLNVMPRQRCQHNKNSVEQKLAVQVREEPSHIAPNDPELNAA